MVIEKTHGRVRALPSPDKKKRLRTVRSARKNIPGSKKSGRKRGWLGGCGPNFNVRRRSGLCSRVGLPCQEPEINGALTIDWFIGFDPLLALHGMFVCQNGNPSKMHVLTQPVLALDGGWATL